MKNLQSFDEFLNEDRIKPGDPRYTNNFFANSWAFNLYNELSSNKSDSPMVIIMKWAENLENTQKLTKEQISDLQKDAMSLRGSSGPKYKQIIKDKILKLLKGEKIR